MISHREAAQTAMNNRDFAAAIAHALLALAEQQTLANLISARNAGVSLTRYQLEEIDSFVRGQVERIEAGT